MYTYDRVFPIFVVVHGCKAGNATSQVGGIQVTSNTFDAPLPTLVPFSPLAEVCILLSSRLRSFPLPLLLYPLSPPPFSIAQSKPIPRRTHTPTTQQNEKNRCEFYECTRQPTYGQDGQRARYCSSHKEDGMIDVKNCRCKHQGCTRQPNYGHEGGRAKYCSSHKLAKMVNVVSRRCEFPACKRQV